MGVSVKGQEHCLVVSTGALAKVLCMGVIAADLRREVGGEVIAGGNQVAARGEPQVMQSGNRRPNQRVQPTRLRAALEKALVVLACLPSGVLSPPAGG
jgi:hypothetical protein